MENVGSNGILQDTVLSSAYLYNKHLQEQSYELRDRKEQKMSSKLMDDSQIHINEQNASMGQRLPPRRIMIK